MRSSLSLPIVVAHEGLGSLNIYDRRVAYFDDDAVRALKDRFGIDHATLQVETVPAADCPRC